MGEPVTTSFASAPVEPVTTSFASAPTYGQHCSWWAGRFVWASWRTDNRGRKHVEPRGRCLGSWRWSHHCEWRRLELGRRYLKSWRWSHHGGWRRLKLRRWYPKSW